MRPLRLGSTLSIVLLVGLGLAQPAARAAFPGSNGKIAFISYRDGNCEIYTANPDGTAQTNVSTNAASDDMPAWSPDGTKIAFTSDRTGSFEIFVMNADGSNVTQLTSDAATFDWEPAWSGDGTKIVFTREGSGEQGLYIVPADGGAATRLTDGHNPDWSPDGTKIAFTNYRFDQGDTSAEIYTIAPNGTGLTRITNNDRIDVDVDWSPDGTKLTVSRFDMAGDVAQNLGVWVMSANGTGATKVSGADPAWDPA
jgi:Tol biopolymer transport system component